MTTKKVRAKRLSTRDKLVVQGKLRREALPICEVGVSAGRVEVIAKRGPAIEHHIYGTNDLVQVQT